MTRANLDRKIKNMLNEIMIIDSMVESATLGAIQALKNRDLDAARTIYQADAPINARRFALEKECMVTIATEQPIMAGDLRVVASILEVVNELERMGDYAKGIARVCLRIGDQEHIKPVIDLPLMAEVAVDMLHRAVAAFVAQDSEQARLIPAEDTRVDDYYQRIYADLIAIITQEPAAAYQANLLMWAAHNLERMADRVTNICERTIYITTGEMIEIDATDDEDLSL
ncbi:MAG TPA: phosphate signaling complex protein PhoU [Anaerolineales bacterium]|nr:phosphate signaling complex protein PhoU [Anaerolineales bacterium]